ncbi:hypothetical protein ACROYT_G038505 [Oculina patagonica]
MSVLEDGILSTRCDPSQVPKKRKIMDTKFHLCLLLIILGSLTMQVHSQQGICEQSGGYCSLRSAAVQRTTDVDAIIRGQMVAMISVSINEMTALTK